MLRLARVNIRVEDSCRREACTRMLFGFVSEAECAGVTTMRSQTRYIRVCNAFRGLPLEWSRKSIHVFMQYESTRRRMIQIFS